MLGGDEAVGKHKLNQPVVDQDLRSLTIEQTDDDYDEHQEAQGPDDGALDPLEESAVRAGEERQWASTECQWCKTAVWFFCESKVPQHEYLGSMFQ